MTGTPLHWRKSTFSGPQHECVEMAHDPAGTVLVRNSNRPGAGTLALAPASMTAWIAGAKHGDLDDLTA